MPAAYRRFPLPMTYCLAIRVNEGLVFAADTRTSAGVDDVRTYPKLHTFEFPGTAAFVLLSAGNLATTQAVLAAIKRDDEERGAPLALSRMRHLYDAAEYVGQLSLRAQKQVAAESQHSGVDFRTTLILGGQIRGEEPGLYLIYPEGNCIATSPDSPYFQIGESKYGKPILDRIVRPETRLNDAARCALVSLDSTMRSNVSVGPPLDLAMLPAGAFAIAHKLRLDVDTPFYARLRESWARSLEAGIRQLPRFEWEAADAPSASQQV